MDKFVKWAREGRDQGRAIDAAISAGGRSNTRGRGGDEGPGKGVAAGAGKPGGGGAITTNISTAGRRCDVASGPAQVGS